ncbi:unnamed protein product [Arctia plantaginis]|uniref:PH domain-containing protein n=1 Tax=Arctia plantaginis TaxID=874455 RepID=A0A8S1APR4_ARCPL|nr:unnamed protein product [Arctia plantaginis]
MERRLLPNPPHKTILNTCVLARASKWLYAKGWAELQQMWENRQQLLTQSLELQLLQRDASQAEVLLSHQEHRLAKTEPPTNLEQAENAIKEHEAFLTTMEANDDKINSVVQFANRLVEERHFDADKIARKAENIDSRRNANREKALQQMEKLQDQLQLHQFLQDCDELGEWVQEKNVTAQDDTYRSAKTIHSKWTRHQAFEAEIAANKERLFAVQNAAEELMKQKPEFVQIISPKMSELQDQFENLQTTTKEKGERLFDANREVLLHQTCDDIDSWMNELEKQIENTDTGTDLASVNILMQKQQMIETQMAVKAKQVTELETQAEYLQKTVPDKMEEIKEKKSKVEERFEQLKAPLLVRQRHLAKKKEAFQFRRDVEDEKLWIHEKMPLATSTDYGNSLFNVQMLQKKNQSLKTETDNHEPRILTVISNGQKLIDEEHEASPEFKQLIDELTARWRELKDAIEERKNKLSQWEKAQQYLFDANEAEAWMSEQELYMMVEDRGKDEISAQNLMKKHEILEQAVDDYAHTIRQLGETVRHLTADEHPLSEQISVKQSQVDKLYAGLKDLAGERRAKLDEALRLFQLSREVDDLEQWITERELVASSQELGQDYDHVTLLWERFKEFARETQSVGSERVATAERIADQMIAMGHSDNATIAQWKEGLKETWQDLLELIETRTQMLAASRELHKYFHDCKDTLQRVNEKARGVSDELGRDAISVGGLQRKHHNFMQDLSTLNQQVEAIRAECGRLGAMYAAREGPPLPPRTGRDPLPPGARAEVREAVGGAGGRLPCAGADPRSWRTPTTSTASSTRCARSRFWMDGRTVRQDEHRREAANLLMNNHQSLKAEIGHPAEDNFSACISLGRELLARQHYASADIKDKLLQLTNQRNALLRRWEERWENLQLILEVYQFARDAAVAEAWLIAQEPYLMSQELGHTIDEVESLIKKHEAFEKSAAAQEDRFSALQRLTTFEVKEKKRRQEAAEAAERESREREAAEAAAAAAAEQDAIDAAQAEKEQPQPQEPEPAPAPEPAPIATSVAVMVDSPPEPSTSKQTPAKPARLSTPGSSSMPATPSSSGKVKSRSRSKSPFRSFRWRTAKKLLTGSHHSDDEEGASPASEDEGVEGTLVRKHEWESAAKRASNRSWDKVYVVAKDGRMSFYKDQKAYKAAPDAYWRGESPLDLNGAVVEVAANYTKKKHVFRLRLAAGAEFLLQAHDEAEMGAWLEALRARTQAPAPRSHTLPAPANTEPKRRSFFTLKKN